MCINSKLELVINLGPRKLDENEIDENFFSVQVSRDDRWGISGWIMHLRMNGIMKYL